MDELEFRNLLVVWRDFFTDIQSTKLEDISTHDNQKEWQRLHNAFKFTRNISEDELISERMSYLLHKYMFVICAEIGLASKFQEMRWLWLIMEIDAQIAKKKATHVQVAGAGTGGVHTEMRNLLSRIQSL